MFLILKQHSAIMDKRTFLKQFSLGLLAATPTMNAIAALVEENKLLPANKLARTMDFWSSSRRHYKLKEDYIAIRKYLPFPFFTLLFKRLLKLQQIRVVKV